MNSNLSVTDDLWQSTLRLFSGTRFPFSVPGFPARARAVARVRSRIAAVSPPRAPRGGGFSPFPRGPSFFPGPFPPRGAGAAPPPPPLLPPPFFLTQKTFFWWGQLF